MSKAYLLVFCLFLSSLTGCVSENEEVKITDGADEQVEPVEEKPVATITYVSADTANLSFLNEKGIVFTGRGETESASYILEYLWGSSIDGFLSSEKSFTTKNLSVGYHTIFFKVSDDNFVWSENAQFNLTITNSWEWDFYSLSDTNLTLTNYTDSFNVFTNFPVVVENLGDYTQDFVVYSKNLLGNQSIVTELSDGKYSDYNSHYVPEYSDRLEFTYSLTKETRLNEVKFTLQPDCFQIIYVQAQ